MRGLFFICFVLQTKNTPLYKCENKFSKALEGSEMTRRTLSSTEQKRSSVKKEAYAVIEALRKWKHFNLVTDQRSVSFMLDLKHPSKIKNNKIQRWRLKFAPYDFTTIYRPGNRNYAARQFF